MFEPWPVGGRRLNISHMGVKLTERENGGVPPRAHRQKEARPNVLTPYSGRRAAVHPCP